MMSGGREGEKNHNQQLTGEDRIEEGKSKTHSHADFHNSKQRHKLRKQNSDLSYNCRESSRKERNIQQAAAEKVVKRKRARIYYYYSLTEEEEEEVETLVEEEEEEEEEEEASANNPNERAAAELLR